MKASDIFMPAGTAVCAAILLSGCGKIESQFSPPATSAQTGAQSRPRADAHPATCTPTVWASGSNEVFGYTAANTPPCVTLHGTYNGLHFQGVYGIAMGRNPKHLYVADLLNSRVVVFDRHGNYLKWLDTKLGNAPYEPWGVCVSNAGVVGVGNIRAASAQGNVEFFPPNAPNGSLPTGDATGQYLRQTWCAFDSAGNFFVVDGSVGVAVQIDYLASSFVGMAGQTLVNAGLGPNSNWVGMYSRVDSPADQTLSVATYVLNSSTQAVRTWNVTGPPAGPLVFTPCACSPYSFTHYPQAHTPVEQAAPSVGGASGVLYFADYGASSGRGGKILQGPANGGHVTTYAKVRGAIGVATRPTGQY